MKRYIFLAGVPVVVLICTLSIAWFYQEPRLIVEQWISCDHEGKLKLIAEEDRPYWDEWSAGFRSEPWDVYQDACLVEAEIAKVDVKGFTATATVTQRVPELTYEDISDFPATATRNEKIQLLKERAKQVERSESDFYVQLKFESLEWRVQPEIMNQVLLERALKSAENLRDDRQYEEALSAYDDLLEGSLEDDARERVLRSRLAVFSHKSCVNAVKGHVKFPESAEFSLSSYLTDLDERSGSVSGEVTVVNAFGVKSKHNVSCEVTLPLDSLSALVDIFMYEPGSAGSMVSEDRLEIPL